MQYVPAGMKEILSVGKPGTFEGFAEVVFTKIVCVVAPRVLNCNWDVPLIV
jgi:hypothetical protein